MDCFDIIIGYESIKNELKRTADVLQNPEVYQKLGVQPPCGLLLHGVPGVGTQSYNAWSFIPSVASSGNSAITALNAFVIRKSSH